MAEIARWAGCTYQGGFRGMKPSPKAAVELTESRLTVRRPRGFSISKRTGVRAIWAGWGAVTEVRVRPEGDGSRLAVTTKARGTGVVLIPGVAPLEVWRSFDQVPGFADRIPARVRQLLEGEPGADPGTLGEEEEVAVAPAPSEEPGPADEGAVEEDGADAGTGPASDSDPGPRSEDGEPAGPEAH